MKEVFFIKSNYKTAENKYVIQGDVALITIQKKDGSELITKIDAIDVEKVKNIGTWFAEWHQDYNTYLVQNITSTSGKKKAKFIKQSLHSIILDTHPQTPIKHINGDPLDNRKSNLQIVEKNLKNEYEIVDEDTVSIILKDKYGRESARALISKEDMNQVLKDEYSWVEYKKGANLAVVANTPKGRIYLDKLIMKADEKEVVKHINLNPLDNRRGNLELVEDEATVE